MIELRYPIIEDAEAFFRILTEGKFEYYHAAIPVSIDAEREWIKKRAFYTEEPFAVILFSPEAANG
jgi:ribosomal-protein-alanine N-acetyltransferase